MIKMRNFEFENGSTGLPRRRKCGTENFEKGSNLEMKMKLVLSRRTLGKCVDYDGV
jgi:hypothetical protein